MKQAAKKVLNAALELPESDRAKEVEELLATLGGEIDEDADAAWVEEIERRTREIKQGKVEPIPWSKVKQAVSRRSRAKC